MNIIYFVPLTWSLNGMEFDIGGRRVDNGVTTSGKEVQEALVNFRRHMQAGSVSKVKGQSKIKRKASSYLSKENAKLQDIPKLLLHIKETLRMESLISISKSPKTLVQTFQQDFIILSLLPLLKSHHLLFRRRERESEPCCFQRPSLCSLEIHFKRRIYF